MWRRVSTVAVCLFLAPPAAAQTEIERFQRQLDIFREETRFRASPEIPVGQRVYFDYGAYVSINYLNADDPNNNNRTLWDFDLVGYARLNLDGVHDFFVRGRESYQQFSSGDDFNDDNGWDGHVERAWYRFDLARYFQAYRGHDINGNVVFKGGRELAFWGNGLTLVQELDGATLDLAYGPLTLQLLAGVTTDGSIDFDSSRPQFDDENDRGFYGLMLSGTVATHKPYIYSLWQQDYNDNDQFTFSPDGGSTQIATNYEYDSYYVGAGVSGAITDRIYYGIEAVYQGGENQSNSFDTGPLGQIVQVPQTTDQIDAWAVDVQLNYLPGDARNTRFIVEGLLASGDDDRQHTSNTLGGNAPGTKDRAFNGFGLINTGVAFAPSVSNLMMLRVGASTFPCPDYSPLRQLQVGTDLFWFAKTDSDAPIDEPTSDDGYLGFEPDIYVNWQITSDVGLALRYGVFFPSDAFDSQKARQFIYAGLTFAF